MSKQGKLNMMQLAPVSWDVIEVNNKIKALNGDYSNVTPEDIYPRGAYLTLTNRIIKSRWNIHVLAKRKFRKGLDDFETVAELFYKINVAMLAQEAAELLSDVMHDELKESFNNLHPDSVIVTFDGNVVIGKQDVRRPTSNRKKARS